MISNAQKRLPDLLVATMMMMTRIITMTTKIMTMTTMMTTKMTAGQ